MNRMKILGFILLSCLNSMSSFACLDAKQHKLFPVGTLNDQIVFLEAHIFRSDDFDNNETDRHQLKLKWKIVTFISVYDKSQNLISTKEIDNSEIKGESYLPLIKTSYTKGLFQIKSLYENLVFFTPDYLSFCDYQKKCPKIEMINDTIAKKDFFRYKNSLHKLKLNSTKRDKSSAFYIRDLSYYYLNSVRIYKTEKIELIIGHAATGHQVSMGWITSDTKKKTNKDGEPIYKAKPYKPDIEIKNLHIPVYQEPILHHGYGNDLFIVIESKK